jgi:hypothetical protein
MVKGFIFEVVYICIVVDLHHGNEFILIRRNNIISKNENLIISISY